jgi:hypothetical protein
MIDATCTWGDGPDVMLTFKDYIFVLYEDPKHTKPPRGDYTHGYVTKGSTDLTADEALELAARLTEAANNAKELDRTCEDHDKMVEMSNVPKLVGEPLSEIDLKAILADYPLETLTCYKCPHRATCKYVDDLYDCLAMK